MNYHDKILELRNQGHSKRKIRELLSCSLHTISTHLPGPTNEIALKIQALRKEGLSMKAIKTQLKCSKSTVSKWCQALPDNDATTQRNLVARKVPLKEVKRVREGHRERSQRSNVYQWKQRLKSARRTFIVNLYGGKCCICGYDKLPQVLHFHHVDPSKKSHILNTNGLIYHSMAQILAEANKCILVCSNHHGEIHFGLLDATPYHKPLDLSLVQIPEELKRYGIMSLDDKAIAREKNWISYKLKLQNRKLLERDSTPLDLNTIEIKELGFSQLKEFLIKYHYLGPSNKGTIKCFGWYSGDSLVGVAQIGNPVRQMREDGICELSRFCLANNTPNLASKCLGLLLRAMQGSKYKKIQTFADADFHTGSIYKAVGFTELYTTRTSYNYSGIHKKTIYERAALYSLHETKYAEMFGLERRMEGAKIKFVKDLG